MVDPVAAAARRRSPRFVTGSTMGHIVAMTAAGATGLMALFLVDFADMYFISLLGEAALAAAIGFAGTVLFFTTAICIGMSIATGALVSRRVGAGDDEGARALAVDSWTFGLVATGALAAAIWTFTPEILSLLGAEGDTLRYATGYLRIVIPSMPLLALGMMAGAVLRGIGDARWPMYSTLAGGFANAVLDPILIFGLGLGIDGAAVASLAARVAVAGVAMHAVVRRHGFVTAPSLSRLRIHTPAIAAIAVPAILTNIATPAGNAYVTWSLAPHGDSAMAGWAVIGRMIPVAFGVIFALSGAIGPIYGQNYGAGRTDRVLRAYTDGLVFISVFVAAITLVLFFSRELVVAGFGLSGEGADLVRLFCTWLAPSFAFTGVLFVSNAAFNNLGWPRLATLFNWGRATAGTIPFVTAGSFLGGASGILVGHSAGALVFGAAAVVTGYRLIRRLDRLPPPQAGPPLHPRRPLWPFVSRRI